MVIIDREDLQKLFEVLEARGYELFAPTLVKHSVSYGRVSSVDQLPIGWVDHQDGGSYRLEKTDRPSLFGYTVGQHSWKNFLYPSDKKIWQASREDGRFALALNQEESVQRALIGVRPCDLKAILTQDETLIHGSYADASYATRRKNVFIVVVHCTRAGGTCFCTSMDTGPKAKDGFDLAMTEVIEEERHYFVVEYGSELGKDLLAQIPHHQSQEKETRAAAELVEAAKSQMGRALDTSEIKDLLYRNFEHKRWDDVSNRCLTCGNCTLVCPTCFCVCIEDSSDLSGRTSERWRRLDSCFTLDFSYIHGGSVRTSERSRYRQWMIHKLASWHDQFGMSGCVGCGRCITWCPVGIDITEETRAIRQSEERQPGSSAPTTDMTE